MIKAQSWASWYNRNTLQQAYKSLNTHFYTVPHKHWFRLGFWQWWTNWSMTCTVCVMCFIYHRLWGLIRLTFLWSTIHHVGMTCCYIMMVPVIWELHWENTALKRMNTTCPFFRTVPVIWWYCDSPPTAGPRKRDFGSSTLQLQVG